MSTINLQDRETVTIEFSNWSMEVDPYLATDMLDLMRKQASEEGVDDDDRIFAEQLEELRKWLETQCLSVSDDSECIKSKIAEINSLTKGQLCTLYDHLFAMTAKLNDERLKKTEQIVSLLSTTQESQATTKVGTD